MSSMTTEEETMALNALDLFSLKLNTIKRKNQRTYLDDPRKIQPKTTTKKSVRYKAFKGTLSLL